MLRLFPLSLPLVGRVAQLGGAVAELGGGGHTLQPNIANPAIQKTNPRTIGLCAMVA